MVEAGETLRSTRVTSGISLEEVSKDINIPVLYLEQIEDGSIGSFDDIYELKKMIMEYAKYLGIDPEAIQNKFNEYMFEYTSRIPMDEIEKAIRSKIKEKEDEDRIASPYTKVFPKEKTLPYILTFLLIVVLVILAVVWSVKQITINTTTTNEISILK